MFRDAYRRRRCILPVDAFYEWKAVKGRKQPYAIAMRDRSPFGIARNLGKLEEPAWRLGTLIRDSDDTSQRTRWHNS